MLTLRFTNLLAVSGLLATLLACSSDNDIPPFVQQALLDRYTLTSQDSIPEGVTFDLVDTAGDTRGRDLLEDAEEAPVIQLVNQRRERATLNALRGAKNSRPANTANRVRKIARRICGSVISGIEKA